MRVIITGATGGYGRALCRQAKLNGYNVLAVSTSSDKLESLVQCGLADELFVLDYLDGTWTQTSQISKALCKAKR